MAAVAAFSEQPVRLFFQDEARMGLHLPKYRRLTAKGVCPVQPFDPLYEYYWLYGAVEPATGEAHFWEMPALNADCFSVYLSELSKAYPETLNVIALDNAPAHIARAVQVPANVVLLPLPSYSPELNPVERLWLHVRQQIDVFDVAVRTTLDGLREHVAEILRSLTSGALQSLTGYGYILGAIRDL